MENMKKSKPVLYDRLIINRVKEYLEENVHQTYLDVGIMAKQLQDRFPEYNRRKIGPFRRLVEQAYRVVSQSYGLDSNQSSDLEGSDLEVMEENSNPNTNQMNEMLANLYAHPKNSNNSSHAAPSAPSGELIDISSDESDDVLKKNGKPKNRENPILPPSVTLEAIASQTSGHFSKGNNSVTIKRVQPSCNQQSSTSAAVPKKRRLTEDGSSSPKQDAALRSVNGKNQIPHDTDGTKKIPFYQAAAVAAAAVLRTRKYKKEVQVRKSRYNFADVGGMEKNLKELCELLMHFKHPDLYHIIGLSPPRGILLHGPPGCGKTLLAHAIAGQLSVPLIEIPATELIAGISGESEERIREIFDQAALIAPCVLFIDDIDAISTNRLNAQKDMERRVVSQLISSLDGLTNHPNGDGVLVIGATTRPEVLDPSLRRVGRFDHELSIGIPDRKGRRDILKIICDNLLIEKSLDFDKIAELTPGYVGADLLALATRSASIAVKRKCLEQIQAIQVKSNKNMQIVDLVDETVPDVPEKGTEVANAKLTPEAKKDDEEKMETEPSTDTNEATKEKDDKPADEPTKDAKENETESVSTTTNEEEAIKDDKKEEETVADASEDKNETEKMDESEVSETTKEPATEAVKTNPIVNEEPIDVDEIAEETPVDHGPLPEPSLFQLINWLEYSPIDESKLNNFHITLEDFKAAVKVVQPSSKREGFITVPDVTWDDIGSLRHIREELQLAVLAPVKFPEKMLHLGLTAPSGLLLCGPPGCGKTLMAKAIANEAGINFISVKGPELMNMYVGESERAVRTCFQRARNSAPCVIFFDEFDSLCPKRSENGEGGSGTRIVNQLLTEMDGVEDRKGVFLMAATNRPDIIDPAILRPGRLDTILYVGLPESEDRVEILEALTKNRTRPALADDVELSEIAAKSESFTGADLAGLVRQASMLALKESITNTDIKIEDLKVYGRHFASALNLMKPSVSLEDRKVYEKLRLKYAAPRAEKASASKST